MKGITNEDLRRKALVGLVYQLAHDNIGIYPQKITGGPNAYEQRSEWQEGWNECSMEHIENYGEIAKFLASIPPEYKTTVEDLLMLGELELFMSSKGYRLAVNCSDTFWWGCADAEDISFKELPELVKCLEETPVGGELWVARKRRMRPQTASYEECYPPESWPLFDAAGPERDDPDGKRRPDVARYWQNQKEREERQRKYDSNTK